MGNCIVAQSGGPTVAINASLAGVIEEAASSKQYDIIYGSLNGITGILNDHIINLSEKMDTIPDFLGTLKVTPAMYLGSCRYKMPHMSDDEAIYQQIFDFFEAHDIVSFFYIGGNDSMDTVLQLSLYAKEHNKKVTIMGVPKTVDNDLCHTDHTPGFGSAAKFVATMVKEIAYDTSIYPIESVTIVEVMGRDAGWLTATACLAKTEYGLGPDLIYLPEAAFSTDDFIEDVKKTLKTKSNALIVISEGIRDAEGNYVSASSSAVDSFGHSQLSGAGKTLEYLVGDKLGVKVRSIELNLPQRCAAHIASETDLNESVNLGKTAVKKALSGVTGHMSTITRTGNDPYTVTYDSMDISLIANEVKSVPRNYINESGNYVTSEMVDYLKPLIIGEPKITYKDGLPVFLDLDHLYE
ncbi:MAG: 6-phosphofructokinase [Lachnospiraceae bacterium]|nr:6-phosphofructokinase [Lachnospiraceae bacterium]